MTPLQIRIIAGTLIVGIIAVCGVYSYTTITKLRADLSNCENNFSTEQQSRLRDIKRFEDEVSNLNKQVQEMQLASEQANDRADRLVEDHRADIIQTEKEIAGYKRKLSLYKKVETCEQGFDLLKQELGGTRR